MLEKKIVFTIVFTITFNCFLLVQMLGISNRCVLKVDGLISEIAQQLCDFKSPDIPTILDSKADKAFAKWIQMGAADPMPVDTGNESDLHDPWQNADKNYDESLNYFGLHVEDAWKKGYNGSGITIAVTDIGISADIIDLRKNLNMNLAYNFIHKTTDVSPEKDIDKNYRAESMRYIDHGNRCASIIAAEKGNGLCNAGIAFAGKVVPLKIFSLLHQHRTFILHTTGDIMGAALSFHNEDIHIYSNSWSPPTKFGPLDDAMKKAIFHGATRGRNELGSIYVFPDGSDGITGSGHANSIHTIAVNSVNIGGSLPKNPEVSACVITSGLGDGNRLSTNNMMTSSYNNACVGSFKGVSAAVAEVSAIIALVLQARSDLTLRDIQLLLAEASDREGLAESNFFNRNAAGKYFHAVLGFGLLNADKAVTNANTWRHVGKLYNNSLRYVRVQSETFEKRGQSVKMLTSIEFSMEADPCCPHVTNIEQVVLRIGHDVINQEGLCIEIVSPSKTTSVIVDITDGKNIDQDNAPRDLTSVHFLGESPVGNWTVRIYLGQKEALKNLRSKTSLTIYGTFNETKGKYTIMCTSIDEETCMEQSKTTKYVGNTMKTESGAATQTLVNDKLIYVLMGFIIKIYIMLLY